MESDPLLGPCPVCGEPGEEAWRPFCSKRCGDIDLGGWLSGNYAIPGEPVEFGDNGDSTDVH